MRIIGIDPGTTTTGFGVIEVGEKSLQAIDYGCITTPPKSSLARRLTTIKKDLTEIIEQTKPEIISIEKLYFSKNVKTALDVGHARGVVLLISEEFQLELSEYAPNEVKKALSGYGAATKSQIQYMVQQILKLTDKPSPDDAADALALALCHAQQLSFQKLINTSDTKTN